VNHLRAVLLVAASTAVLAAACTRPSPVAPPVAEPDLPTERPATAPVAEAPPPSVTLAATEEPAVSMAAWFQVGSQDDPPGKEGLAWLTGQLIARGGTKANRYEEILALLYPMAARYQVSIDREMTVVSGRAHRDHGAAYQALFLDAFTRPAFDAADFERLRAEALAHIEKSLRYALDEELGKAALHGALFAGTGYGHPPQGTVASLQAITLEDVVGFWRRHYTGGRVTFAIAGGWTPELLAGLEASRARLPGQAAPPRAAPPAVTRPRGRQVLLVDKPGADASISFGAPIEVRRGHPDFAALYLAASWLGEHRNQSSHLYQVIRAARGLNYGDYAYVEAYPDGGRRQTPPPSAARRQQLFEVWIRTLPNDNAVFALRAALRATDRLIDQGMSAEQFELTRDFLRSYVLHYAPSTHDRLLWRLDDRFYGLEAPHLDELRRQLDGLTVEKVNAALRRHLSTRDLVIAIATGKPAELRAQLTSGAATRPTYATPKPAAVLEEDDEIASYPLGIADDSIQVVKVDDMFARGSRK
jgi:zinc protease